MDMKNVCVATITWARDAEEETLLRESLQQLSKLNLRVFVTDGGSNSDFINFVQSLPLFTIVEARGKGLWWQVNSSLQAAYDTQTPFILYTEPDKKDFFQQGLSSMLQDAAQDENAGVVLASRSTEAFATFPKFQQTCETTINYCCAEITGQPLDYTYGPFLLKRKLVPYLAQVKPGIGWGWRPYAFCVAHRLGLRIDEIKGAFACPPSQRKDDAKERIYRMKQLEQNIDGIVQAAIVELDNEL
jgi:hypothetical protein